MWQGRWPEAVTTEDSLQSAPHPGLQDPPEVLSACRSRGLLT